MQIGTHGEYFNWPWVFEGHEIKIPYNPRGISVFNYAFYAENNRSNGQPIGTKWILVQNWAKSLSSMHASRESLKFQPIDLWNDKMSNVPKFSYAL